MQSRSADVKCRCWWRHLKAGFQRNATHATHAFYILT